MKQLTLVLLGLLLVDCSSIDQKTSTKSLVLESLWTRSTYLENYLGFRYLNRSTPVLYKDLVIQANAFDGVVAYDNTFGNKVWKRIIPSGVEGGILESGGRLYFGSSGAKFYCLNATNGQIIWSFDFKSEGLAAPAVDADTVYFVSGANGLYALDRATGQQKWFYTRKDSTGLSVRGASQPLLQGDTLYAGFSDGAVAALDKNTGRLKWEKTINDNKRFRDVDAQPVYVDGVLYVPGFDASLVAMKAENGEAIWKYDDGGFDSVTIHDKTIFYSTSTGKLVALDASSGKKLWEYQVTDGYATKATWYRGLLIFGESSGSLVVVDAGTGNVQKRFNPVRGVASPIAVRENGEVFFISRDANLFKLQLAWKRPQDYWPWER